MSIFRRSDLAPESVPSIAELAAQSGIKPQSNPAKAFEMSQEEVQAEKGPAMGELMEAWEMMQKLKSMSQAEPQPELETEPAQEEAKPSQEPIQPQESEPEAKAQEAEPETEGQPEPEKDDPKLESIPENKPQDIEIYDDEPLLDQFPNLDTGSVIAESVVSLEPTAPPQSPMIRSVSYPGAKIPIPTPKYSIGQRVRVKFIGEDDTITGILEQGTCEPRYALQNCGGGVLESMLEPIGKPPAARPAPNQRPAPAQAPSYPAAHKPVGYPPRHPAWSPAYPADPQQRKVRFQSPPQVNRPRAQAVQPKVQAKPQPKAQPDPITGRQFVPPKFARGQHVLVKCTGDRDIIVAIQGGSPECRYTLQKNGPNIVESMLEPVLVPKGSQHYPASMRRMSVPQRMVYPRRR